MLSSSFDISEFIRKVEGHSKQDMIYLADQEATAAERYIYKHKKCRQNRGDSDNCRDARTYVVILKDLVQYYLKKWADRIRSALGVEGKELLA